MAGKRTSQGQASRDVEQSSASRESEPFPGAAEELRDARTYLETIIQTSHDGILVVDKEGKFEFGNAAFFRIFGWPPDEVIGHHFTKVVPPDLQDFILARWREVQSGRGEPYEVDIVTKSGDRRSLLVSHRHMTFRGERKYSVITKEVTEQKRAERARADSERRYRMLVETMNEGVVVVDADGRTTYANDSFCEMLGYTHEELLELRNLDIVAPPDAALLRERFASRRRGLQEPYEARLLHKDGSTVWVRISPRALFDEDGSFTGSFAVFLDITRRRQAEEALRRAHDDLEVRVLERTAALDRTNEQLRREVAERERTEQALRASELLYRATVDGMDEPMHVVTRSLRIELVNAPLRQWCCELGVDDDLVGKGLYEAFPFLHDRVRREYDEVFRTGRPLTTEDSRQLEGQEIITEVRKLPLAENGRVVRVITVLLNVTEKRRMERALREVRTRVENVREEERRHLARELHDSVGQQLVAARMRLMQAARRGGGEAGSSGRPPEDVMAELAEMLGSLSEEVRQVSRTLYPQALAVMGLCSGLRQLVRDCDCPEVELAVRCRGAAREARFDPDIEIAFFRIAQEAVVNALRHAEADEVLLDLILTDNGLALTVTDNGRGFDPDGAAADGVGLTSMRERAEAVRAIFRLTSRPGRTRVAVIARGVAPR